MKKTRLMSAFLATAVLSGVIGSVPVIAEEDTVLYTYQNEQGETVNITQSEIDAGHWNVDALGDRAPVVYKDFPVIMNPSVDDFANLAIEFQYLKDTTAEETATVTFTDMYTGEISESLDLTNGTAYTENLPMDGYYRVTVTEQFSGETAKEYARYISTAYETAEMPEYVTNPTADDTDYISIVDTAKIALATTTDENGRMVFDADVAAYTNVPANEWIEYCKTLEEDKLYLVSAGFGVKEKRGFISTYDWGEDLGIFNPGYTLYDEDISQKPMTTAFDPNTIGENYLLYSQEYYYYGDALFNAGTNNYAVLNYTMHDVPSEEENDDVDAYDIYVNATMGFYIEVWYKRADESTITRVPLVSYASNTGNKHIGCIFDPNSGRALMDGDVLYFVIYSTTNKGIKGSFCLTKRLFPDDVTGSAYEQYTSGNSVDYATYYDNYDEDLIWTTYGRTYTATNIWDMDTFYIDNTHGPVGNIDNGYSIVFYVDGKRVIENGVEKQKGSDIRVTLYYVDFSLDAEFILVKKSSVNIRAYNEVKGRDGEGCINFDTLNSSTKYFFEVIGTSGNDYTDSSYTHWTMFYPQT